MLIRNRGPLFAPDPAAPPTPAPAPIAAPAVDPAVLAAIRTELDARDAKLLAAIRPSTPTPAAPAPIVPPAPAAPQTDGERLAFLEKESRENKEKEAARVRTGALDGAFETAKKDFTAPQLVALRAVFEQNHGKNILVEGDKAFYNSPETGKIEVSAFMATFLKSDVATSLKPAPALPGGAPLQPSTGTQPAPSTAHKWDGKSFREVQTLKNQDPQAYRELITKPEYRASYLKMMASA